MTPVFQISNRVFCRFIGNGNALTGATSQGPAIIWDGGTGLKRSVHGWGPMFALDVSESGLAIIGKLQGDVELRDLNAASASTPLGRHAGNVTAVALSRDARLAASAGMDRQVRLFDVAAAREIRAAQLHETPASCLAIAARNDAIAAGNSDGTGSVWDLSRPAAYLRFAQRVPDARARLLRDPDDGAALAELADWYAFRREWPWANSPRPRVQRRCRRVRRAARPDPPCDGRLGRCTRSL
jgi:WD40 repeat protein